MTSFVSRHAAGLRRFLVLVLMLLGMSQFSACATVDPSDEDSAYVEYDPFEPINRKMYKLNVAVDKAMFKPLAKAYKKVLPTPVRRAFANIFSNFGAPRSALNNFLQGKPKRGFNELGRFLFNSTLGIGGIFDVASEGGMERYDENFAQTLAVWGVPEGPYLILPFLPPQSMLDATALPIDYYSDLNTYLKSGLKDRLYLFRVLDGRARLLSAESFLDTSKDPYIAMRESYRQNRAFKIYDGDPPSDEEFYEDELFDEFFEDEQPQD